MKVYFFFFSVSFSRLVVYSYLFIFCGSVNLTGSVTIFYLLMKENSCTRNFSDITHVSVDTLQCLKHSDLPDVRNMIKEFFSMPNLTFLCYVPIKVNLF